MKCLVDVPENPHMNYSKSDGAIGVDCNLEHFTWVNVTKAGNYKGSGSLRFSIMENSTGQITKIIEMEVSERMKSMFTSEKMTSAILSRTDKRGAAVFLVNPTYTSISGKMKYMRKFGSPFINPRLLRLVAGD